MNLKEINIAIAEGNQAKELLLDKIYKLSICDSLLEVDNIIINNLNKQILIIGENIQILENQKVICINDLNKEKNRKNLWKTIGISEFITIFVLLITYLTIK